MDDARFLAAALVATLALGAALALVARRRLNAWRVRRRMARAAWGELRAEKLLAAHGYRLEARQVPASVRLFVDDAPFQIEVRVDLIVRRRGRRYAAEVKTGARAPHLDHAPTRRQLLEYAHAYDVDGLLLVDAEADRIREVRFPSRRDARASARSLAWGLGVGLAVGAALGWGAAGASGTSTSAPGTLGTSAQGEASSPATEATSCAEFGLFAELAPCVLQ